MHRSIALSLLTVVLRVLVATPGQAQPADCPPPPTAGASLPLLLDLAGRPGVPTGTAGQMSIDLPLLAPGYACAAPAAPPPADVLGGDPGDVLRGPPSADLLRGSHEPRYRRR